jgi:hypothetical protein
LEGVLPWDVFLRDEIVWISTCYLMSNHCDACGVTAFIYIVVVVVVVIIIIIIITVGIDLFNNAVYMDWKKLVSFPLFSLDVFNMFTESLPVLICRM